MNKRTFKIFRKRQGRIRWVDITTQYDASGEIAGDVLEYAAFAYAEEYKKKHKSDCVKVVEINQTEHEITLLQKEKKHK